MLRPFTEALAALNDASGRVSPPIRVFAAISIVAVVVQLPSSRAPSPGSFQTLQCCARFARRCLLHFLIFHQHCAAGACECFTTTVAVQSSRVSWTESASSASCTDNPCTGHQARETQADKCTARREGNRTECTGKVIRRNITNAQNNAALLAAVHRLASLQRQLDGLAERDDE